MAPAPLQDLRRYYEPVRPCASRYSAPDGFCRPGFSLSQPTGNPHPSNPGRRYRDTGSPLPCQRPRRAHATLTPSTTRATRRPPSGYTTPNRVMLSQGYTPTPVAMLSLFYDASAVVQPCSSSRRTPDPLIASRFRDRFPPRLLTGMTSRRFGLPACTANPEDLPPSLAQHGSQNDLLPRFLFL